MHHGHQNAAHLEEQAILLVGADIYETLIESYTEKQWERPFSELPASLIKRLPVRLMYDNNYFNESYQGIPGTVIRPLWNGCPKVLKYA